MTPIKICTCGVKFYEIPKNAKVTKGDEFAGHWFPCRECWTTLFIPEKGAKEGAA